MGTDQISLKEAVYQTSLALLQEKTNSMRAMIEALKIDLFQETKSTSGDKHETGRAMVQIEVDNHQKQLLELLKMQEILERVDPTQKSDLIRIGSLVYTNLGVYYLTVGLGKVQINDTTTVFVVSEASPIAQAFLGLKESDTFLFNNQSWIIERVL